MAIPAGTRIGPHEILAPLGAGGCADGKSFVVDVLEERTTMPGREPAQPRVVLVSGFFEELRMRTSAKR